LLAMEDTYPVYINVLRPDGTREAVRVGRALRQDDGFVLQLGELTMGGAPLPGPPAAASVRAPVRPPGGGPVFPNYGRSKGMPIEGASPDDLGFYANGCRRTLADPGKARWHDKERELLAAIEAEQARQGLSGGPAASPPASPPARRPSPSFAAGPPPEPEPPLGEEPPFPDDEDLPF